MVDPIGVHKSQLPAPGTSSLGAGAKEEKTVKETRKMFKEIGRVASKVKGMPGAFGAIGAGIESVMPFLETLAPLFQAFEPILTIVNAGFTAFAGAITAELVPALQPLFIALIGMIPIFMELGTIIGQVVVIVLVPLIDIFVLLLPPIMALVLMLIQTEGFTTILMITLGVLGGVLLLLVYPIGIVIGVIIVLTTVFNAIGGFINDVFVPALVFVWNIFLAIGNFIYSIFVPAIFVLALGIAFLIDAFTLGLAGAVDWVYANVPSFQRGIDRVPATGLAMVHEGERITPAGEVGLEASLLEEIRDLQMEQLEEIRWRTR